MIFSTITLIKTSGIEKSYFIHIKNCYKIIIVFKNSTDFGCIFCNIVNKKQKTLIINILSFDAMFQLHTKCYKKA